MAKDKDFKGDIFKPVLNRDRNWSALPVQTPEPVTSPHVAEIKALEDNAAPIINQATAIKIDSVPEWAKPEMEVRFHVVVDGHMEKDPVGPVVRGLSLSLIESVMKQLSRFGLSQIHHYAITGAHTNDLYRTKELVDVLIRIGDETFTATRHCLSCHSNLFANIFLNNIVPAYAMTDITLVDVDREMFSRFMHFIHFGEVSIDEHTVEPLLRVCDILESTTLKAKIILFANIKAELKWNEAILILQKSPTALDRLISIQVLVKKFKSLMDRPVYFKALSMEDMKDIISSDDLSIMTELDAFWSVLYWTILDKVKRLEHLDTLMQCVRFTCMSTLELIDCARANNMMSISTTCRQLLVKAHWICHAQELGLDDPLSLTPDTPRNHLIDEAPYVPTVKEFDTRFLVFKYLGSNADRLSINQKREKKTKDKKKKRKKGKKGKAAEKKSRKEETETQESEPEQEPEPEIEVEVVEAPVVESEAEAEVETKKKSTEKKAKPKPPTPAPTTPKAPSATHEFKGGKWKRKRHRGTSRKFDVSQAIQDLMFDDDDFDDTTTDTDASDTFTATESEPGDSQEKDLELTEMSILSEEGPSGLSEQSPAESSEPSPVVPSESIPDAPSESSPASSLKSSPTASLESSPAASLESSPATSLESSPVASSESSPAGSPPPEEDSRGDSPAGDNTSQNYRNVRMSVSDMMSEKTHEDNAAPSTTPNLLDEPDGVMTRHLVPVLQPIRISKTHTKRLSRLSSDDG